MELIALKALSARTAILQTQNKSELIQPLQAQTDIKRSLRMSAVFWGLLIPFIGTAAGSACVFLLKKELKAGIQRAL